MVVENDIRLAKALFREAALSADLWPEALAVMARACGGWVGQLIGLDGAGRIVTHVLTGTTADQMREIEAFGLSDATKNPRLRIGRNASVLAVVADQEHVDPEMRRRHPIYGEYFDRMDLSFNCQTVLMRAPNLLLRTSITRSARQGPLEAEEFRAFAALAPHVQTAARMQVALEGVQVRASVRMLDALDAPGLLLDRQGGVIAVSQAADAAMSQGRLFRSHGRRLLAIFPDDEAALQATVGRALAADANTTAPAELILRDTEGRSAFSLEIVPIPGDGYVLGLAPAVLIVARPARSQGGSPVLAMGAWRLSRSEADIAIRLAQGQALEDIARTRGVALTTVRSQLQAVYLKAGVRRQAELVAAVLALGAA